jgi:hypothetical protein
MSADDELQAWLDEQDAQAEAERKEREAASRAYRLANKHRTWEHIRFDFQRDIYAKAIGVMLAGG